MDGLESKIMLVDNKVMGMEEGTDFMNKEVEGVKIQLKTANADLGKMTKRCTDLESMLTNIESQNQTLQDR